MASKALTDVDPKRIIQVGTELDTIVQNMKGYVHNISSAFSGLDKSWSGEAKVALFQMFEADEQAFYSFISEYQKVNDAIKAMGKNYQTVQNEVMVEVSKLKK